MRKIWIFFYGCLSIVVAFPAFATEPLQSVDSSMTKKQPRKKSETEVNVTLEYGQSADAWHTVSQVKGAKGDLSAINSVLQKKYGSYDEAVSQVAVQATRISVFPESRLFRWLDISTQAEGDGFGLAQNPVVPEIHANALLAGRLGAGLSGDLPSLGVQTRLGLTGGAGYEKRIDAYSTDVIDALPIRSGRFYLVGADEDVSRRFHLSSGDLLDTSLSLKETLFMTTISPSALDEVGGTQFVTFRWKARGTWTHPSVFRLFGRTDVGIETVAGPQPLPVEVLPRVWDYAHRLNPLPEAGSLVGAGGRIQSWFSRNSAFDLRAGFYGGYWGGETGFQTGGFRFTAGSWGVEASSAYQGLGQRIWIGSAGISF